MDTFFHLFIRDEEEIIKLLLKREEDDEEEEIKMIFGVVCT